MYANLQWLDHAITPDKTFTMTDNGDGTYTLEPYGTVVQQGTNMSATNFNNMELGITDHDLGLQIAIMYLRQLGWNVESNTDEITVEEQELTMTNNQSYPFNTSAKTVSLDTTRNNTNYIVDYEIEDSNGNVGEIEITDKALNGFKVAFTGSATSVTVTLKIMGGMAV